MTPLHAPPPPHASSVAASVARVGITRGCDSARQWLREFTCTPERLHVPASANLSGLVTNFARVVGRTLSQVVERVGVDRICSVGYSVRSSSSHRCRWWCRVQYHLGPDMILNLQLHGREGNDSGHHRSQQAPSNLHMTTGLAATTAVRGRPPEEEPLLAHAHTRSLLVLASAPTARFPRLGRVLRLMARCVRTPSSPAGRPPVPAPRPPHAHAHDRLSNGRRGRDAHGRGRQARRAARRGVALVRG